MRQFLGVTVVLSRMGNADLTTTTDANGEYLFGNLFPGDYIVKPQQTGRMFSPFNPSVRLDTGSRRVDFVRGLLPSLSSITVVTNDDFGFPNSGEQPRSLRHFWNRRSQPENSGSKLCAGSKALLQAAWKSLEPQRAGGVFQFC